MRDIRAAFSEAQRVLCWGLNAYGQLGVGDFADRPVASTVAADLRFRPWYPKGDADRIHPSVARPGSGWCRSTIVRPEEDAQVQGDQCRTIRTPVHWRTMPVRLRVRDQNSHGQRSGLSGWARERYGADPVAVSAWLADYRAISAGSPAYLRDRSRWQRVVLEESANDAGQLGSLAHFSG